MLVFLSFLSSYATLNLLIKRGRGDDSRRQTDRQTSGPADDDKNRMTIIDKWINRYIDERGRQTQAEREMGRYK